MSDAQRNASPDAQRLQQFVATWWETVDSFTRLLEEVPAEAWSTPTDLAGWDVRAVAAHVAHLEGVTSGKPDVQVDIGKPAHVRGLMGEYTEQGVVARRDASPDELIAEVRESATKRHTELLADPPTDPEAPAPGVFAMLGWTVERLLKNRPLDVWMHDQDVRRALDVPRDYDTAPARHAITYLMESLPVVVGKRVAPPAGTAVTVSVDGFAPYTLVVGEDGRARRDEEAEPTVTLAMDPEAFVVLAGGRRAPETVEVTVTGDEALAKQVIAALAVTP